MSAPCVDLAEDNEVKAERQDDVATEAKIDRSETSKEEPGD